MPSADDIAAQQALLAAHRQTLAVLLAQQAQFGTAYAPPAIVNGIAAARDAIAQIKQALRGWHVAVEDLPNDQATPDRSSDMLFPSTPHAQSAGGDMIIATIGAGAQGVAVGKQITQSLGAAASPADDRRAIELLLARLEQDLAAGSAASDAATMGMASFQLRLLAGELSKTDQRATPSASTIMPIGDWLFEQLPALRPGLVALFTASPVLRVLARADASLDDWRARRFGG